MLSERFRYVFFWCIVYAFNYVLSINIKGFDDTILFKINWPGLNSEDFIVSCWINNIIKSCSKYLTPYFRIILILNPKP